MSDNAASGFLAVLAIVGAIACWITAGVLAWDWAEPDNFWGGVKFLIAWSVLGYIFQFLGALLLAGIAYLFGESK